MCESGTSRRPENRSAGLWISGGRIDGPRIEGAIVAGNRRGIVVYARTGNLHQARVVGCVLTSNELTALALSAQGRVRGAHVERNIAAFNRTGVVVSSSEGSDGVRIRANSIYSNADDGLSLSGGNDTLNRQVRIQNNHIVDNVRRGIDIYRPHRVEVLGNPHRGIRACESASRGRAGGQRRRREPARGRRLGGSAPRNGGHQRSAERGVRQLGRPRQLTGALRHEPVEAEPVWSSEPRLHPLVEWHGRPVAAGRPCCLSTAQGARADFGVVRASSSAAHASAQIPAQLSLANARCGACWLGSAGSVTADSAAAAAAINSAMRSA